MHLTIDRPRNQHIPRKPIVVFLFVLAMGVCTGQMQAQTVRVGIIGDQTGSYNIDDSYKILKKGIDVLRGEKIDVAIHTGDLVESSKSDDEYKARFAEAVETLNSLGKPWHLSPGDHDVNPSCFIPDSADRSNEDRYKRLYKQKEPGLTDTLSHSFDIAGYHFISLNALERLHSDPKWGDNFLDRISAEQLDWLKQDLQSHRSTKGVIVFMHHPMWYNWGGWKPVHDLLRDYHTLAVVAGHFHYPQDEGLLDNIHYFVVGATGGEISRGIKTISRNGGAVQHVTVMTVSPQKVVFKLITLDDNREFKVGTREDMDRVQAVVTSLNDLYKFAEQNPVYLGTDGHLYGSNKQPLKLKINPVGNPIDLPVKVTVKFENDKLDLTNTSFLVDPASPREGCQRTDGGECTLGPSARVVLSNPAMVNFIDPLYLCDYSSRPMRPLWESGIDIKNGASVSVGDVITLTIRLSFQTPRGEFFVEQSATTKIAREK